MKNNIDFLTPLSFEDIQNIQGGLSLSAAIDRLLTLLSGDEDAIREL